MTITKTNDQRLLKVLKIVYKERQISGKKYKNSIYSHVRAWFHLLTMKEALVANWTKHAGLGLVPAGSVSPTVLLLRCAAGCKHWKSSHEIRPHAGKLTMQTKNNNNLYTPVLGEQQ